MDMLEEELPAPEGHEITDLPVCTATSAERLKEAVIDGPHQTIRNRLRHLFLVENLAPKDIAPQMDDMLLWPEGTMLSTKIQLVRRMIKAIVPDDERKPIQNARKFVSDDTLTARREWMEKEGMLVWSDDEAAYFLKLMRWKKMWRFRGRCNHELIAAEMNKYSGSTRFESKKTMQHLLNLRHKTDTPVPTFEEATDDFTPEVRPVAAMPSAEPIVYVEPAKPVSREIERRKGESLQSAAARDLAKRLNRYASGAFGEAAALADGERWAEALVILDALADDYATMSAWRPVQHEFYALVLLCVSEQQRAKAGKHLEFARRGMAEGDDSFSNVMTLPPEVAAALTDEASDDGDRSHPRRHVPSRSRR